MDDFLRHHRVDICRSLAVLGFAGAISDTIAMIVQPAFTGTFTLNFGPIISIWLSCALWMRRPWARKLLIGLGWLAAFAVVGVTIKVLFFGDVTLTFYGTNVAKPTVGQYWSLFLVSVPAVYMFLRIFHSGKFREEVYPEMELKVEPGQSSEPSQGMRS